MPAVPESLTFHRSLYAPPAVRVAAAAFASLATIEVLERENETFVTLSGIDPDVASELLDAFANHVLFETIRLRNG